jgi:hypothetical protein
LRAAHFKEGIGLKKKRRNDGKTRKGKAEDVDENPGSSAHRGFEGE